MWRHLYMAGLAVVVPSAPATGGLPKARGRARPIWPDVPTQLPCPPAWPRLHCPAMPDRCGATTTSAATRRGSPSTSRPEQAIIDWILRDTGYEIWHSEPVCLLRRGAADLARLSHPGNAEAGGRAGRTLHQQRGGRLYVLDAGGHARQPSLAHHGGPAVAAGSGADRRRPCLGPAQGRRRDPGRASCAAARLPRAVLALPDHQQRPGDGHLVDARPAVRSRRGGQPQHGGRLRALAGAGR